MLVGQNETAGTTPPVSNAIMVAVNSPIKSMADLRGKRVSTASPRGQSFAAVKELLQRNGVSVNQVQITGTPFSIADLLRSGQVDAVVSLDPYTTQISKAGYGRTISWFMIETIPDEPVGAWWSRAPGPSRTRSSWPHSKRRRRSRTATDIRSPAGEGSGFGIFRPRSGSRQRHAADQLEVGDPPKNLASRRRHAVQTGRARKAARCLRACSRNSWKRHIARSPPVDEEGELRCRCPKL